MMRVTFEAVELDRLRGDRYAILAFNDGRPTAVLCELDDHHGPEFAKRWFVEATFGDAVQCAMLFDSPDDFANHLQKR